jgi:Cu+-exporting ATPase
MKKDVVCGVQVDEDTATNNSDYTGKMFYFCSPACKAKFDHSPEAYASRGAQIRQHLSAVYTPPVPDSKPS